MNGSWLSSHTWAVIRARSITSVPVFHETGEQREFLGGQLDRPAAASDAAAAEIDLEIGNGHHFGLEVTPATGQGADARQQLAEGKGLGEIVVRADVEARDAVVHGIARGEHQDRRG